MTKPYAASGVSASHIGGLVSGRTSKPKLTREQFRKMLRVLMKMGNKALTTVFQHVDNFVDNTTISSIIPVDSRGYTRRQWR